MLLKQIFGMKYCLYIDFFFDPPCPPNPTTTEGADPCDACINGLTDGLSRIVAKYDGNCDEARVIVSGGRSSEKCVAKGDTIEIIPKDVGKDYMFGKRIFLHTSCGCDDDDDHNESDEFSFHFFVFS